MAVPLMIEQHQVAYSASNILNNGSLHCIIRTLTTCNPTVLDNKASGRLAVHRTTRTNSTV